MKPTARPIVCRREADSGKFAELSLSRRTGTGSAKWTVSNVLHKVLCGTWAECLLLGLQHASFVGAGSALSVRAVGAPTPHSPPCDIHTLTHKFRDIHIIRPVSKGCRTKGLCLLKNGVVRTGRHAQVVSGPLVRTQLLGQHCTTHRCDRPLATGRFSSRNFVYAEVFGVRSCLS